MKMNPFQTKKQKKRENQKMVGGYFPLSLVQRIRLLAVYQGRSVQNIFQQIVEQWSESADVKPNDVVIKELAKRAFEEWERRKNNENEVQISEYLKELNLVLTRRKVSRHHIEEILDLILIAEKAKGGGGEINEKKTD